MSETRYSEQDFLDAAESETTREHPPLADMLQQAARDARVIAQLRTWLESQIKAANRISKDSEYVLTFTEVLDELDRLTREPRTP